MRRVLSALILCLIASPLCAQPVYVAGTAGAHTTFSSHATYLGIDEPDGTQTALVLAGRIGLTLGPRWGVELEVARALEVDERLDPRILLAQSSVIGSTGIDAVFPSFLGETSTSRTIISPVAWVSHPLSNRVDLVFLGGVAFERTVTETSFDFPRLSPISIFPPSASLVQYDTGVMTGVEARIAVGSHLRVIPSFRLQAVGNAWALRPAAGVGWTF